MNLEADITTHSGHLRLSILRGFDARVGAVRLRFSKQKAAALLALLVVGAPHPTSRAMLRGILWSDVSETDAQNSLRNTLWVLKKQLQDAGYNGLGSDRTSLWLEPGSFSTDFGAHLDQLSLGQVPIELMPQNGFPDQLFSSVDATDLYAEQVNQFRTRARVSVLDACCAALARCPDQPLVALLQLLVSLDPLNEEHCRNLVRALIADGRKSDALAEYQRFWNALDDEYGEEPSLETQSIIVSLKQGDAPQSPYKDGKPIIVVNAPKEGRGPHDLHETVMSVLVRFREWQIMNGSYLGDLSAVLLRAQGTVGVLTFASFQIGPDGATVRSVLTDARTGQVLWSEPLDLEQSGNAASLERPIRQLATALNLHMSGFARPIAQEHPEQGQLSYERWVEAQHLTRQFTHASWGNAQDILDATLENDPTFVRALASRAAIETMRHIAFPGVARTMVGDDAALRWAGQAITLDPMDSRAQLAFAWACAMSRQFERAGLAYELAFQHNENDPWTIVSAAVGLAFCDQTDRALALLDYLEDLTVALEPIHWSYIAATQFLAGNDAKCVVASERAHEVSCDVPAWHAAALAHLGEIDAARAVVERFCQISTQNWGRDTPPSDRDMLNWVLSSFPIRNPQSWERLSTGLARAGLRPPDPQ